MKILDLYILKKFLIAFFFIVILFVTIICIINLTEVNDDFIKHNLGGGIILKYYLYYAPYMANLISPLMVFIATVFVTAKMASHTEIVAMLSSGISFRRIMFPYLIGSGIVAVLTFFLVGWVIPETSKFRVAFDIKYIKNPFLFEGRNVHFKVGDNSYAYMESYNNVANTGYRFTIEKIEGTKLIEKLKAEYITWVPETQKWRIQSYELHTFNGTQEKIVKGEKLDTLINLYPRDFQSTYLLHEMLTLQELNKHIGELRNRGIEKIEIFLIQKYTIFTYPFAIIILTMIGLIVSARKSRGGAGFQIALGFLIAFVYIIFVVMSRSIAQAGSMDPLIAVWLPNVVFSIIGIAMYYTVPR